MEDIEKYCVALISKSKEAALMSLEIINKPTIKYRTEGFCFFICNAWELLLKAKIVKDKGSIDSINVSTKDGKTRTISLNDAVKTLFTSTDNKYLLCLRHVIAIRNRATHLILSSDDVKYAPLFQNCIQLYFEFLNKSFHEYSFKDFNPYITLAIGNTTPNMTEDYLSINEDVKAIIEDEEHDESFITLKHRLYITKKPDEADMKVMITKDADKKAIILNLPKDYNITHPYNSKKAIEAIKDLLKTNGLDPQLFNSFSFKMACRNLKIRDNEKYCHKITLYKNPMYQYSLSAIEFISSEFINNKSVFEECKSRTNKQKNR